MHDPHTISVRIRQDHKAALEQRKWHPRESIDDVLARLLATPAKPPTARDVLKLMQGKARRRVAVK